MDFNCQRSDSLTERQILTAPPKNDILRPQCGSQIASLGHLFHSPLLRIQMTTSVNARRLGMGTSRSVLLAAAVLVSPSLLHAQSGKFVGTATNLKTIGGAADIKVENKGDKQSKVKISLRNSKAELRVGWDVAEGRCGDEGRQVAPQAAFPVVQNMMDGSGESSASVKKLETGKLYYVRIFDSTKMGTDASAYGCANLAEQP